MTGMEAGRAAVTALNRRRLAAASDAIVKAGRGLVIDHGVGYDPVLAEAGRPAWWAKARIGAANGIMDVVAEPHVTGLDALVALADRVAAATVHVSPDGILRSPST